MATFVVSSDDTMRWGPEETLAAELRRREMDAVAGYTVLPGELAKDTEKAKEFLKKAGITGAVMMRIVGYEKETHRQTVTNNDVYPDLLLDFLGLLGPIMVDCLRDRFKEVSQEGRHRNADLLH